MVNASGLSGFVLARLPGDHALRRSLRQVTLNLSFRHGHIRAELRELLQAWHAAGLPFVLLKGFALAEFEYATPTERFYGDVDVLLPGNVDTVQRAHLLALAHGWHSDGMQDAPELWTHETMHLFSPDGHIRLDVHRDLVPSLYGVTPSRARELTRQVWGRATVQDWDGLHVRLMHPLDAALLVAVGRTWGGDQGGVKPADYADLLVLKNRYGLTGDRLVQHAQLWQAEHTWKAFTQLCNPWQAHLTLDPQVTAPVLRAAVVLDGLKPGWSFWKAQFSRLWHVAPQLPAALGHVLAATAAVRAGGDPRAHLRRWQAVETPRRAGYRRLTDRFSAINFWLRVLYPRQSRQGVCVPRAYATFRSFQRLGYPVSFVSGVARGPQGVVGHAWLEDGWGEMEFYGMGNRRAYRINLIFPERS